MTVSSSTNRASYSGNGSLTTFAYGFKVFDQDDLTVILRASNGTETVQTITTHYTVTGVGDVGGGNVVFGTAPASGVTVVILREMDLEQGLDLVPNDPFPAQSLEDSLDKLTFMVQQHDEQLGRAIKASRTNVITGSEFVISAADRANKVFAFDSSGDVSITQEIGTFRGDWAASTAYVERDLVKDTTTNDVFIVNSAHTSSGSLPLTTNTNSAKYEKIIDISNPPGDLTVGGNISTSGSVTAGSFVIGSADINENDLESIDSITAGTVAASKAVVVDVNKDISSFRNLTASGDITFGGLSDGTITVTDILDEDDLTSNSATSLATQQSIKAYVDSQVGSFDTLAEVLANGNTTGGTNLSVSTGDDIKFADGSQAIFGAGDDLRINHTGSNSYISDLGEGPLFIGGNDEVSIMNGQLNEYKIKAETNGAVTLYYDNAVKMATTTLGIDVTGTITFDGGETTADLYFGDNDKAIFGAGSDLQIYHDGSHSYIKDNGTGNLLIQGSAAIVLEDPDGNNMIYAEDGGPVYLYSNGSQKLATTNTGVDITGTAVTDGLTVAGNVSVDGGTIKLDGNYPVGTGNVALGDFSFAALQSGASSNVSIGYYSGYALTTGDNNTALGASAVHKTTTASGNTGIGRGAIYENSTGASNTAVGDQALYFTTASFNTAVGYHSAFSNTTGSPITAMGYYTLDQNTTGVHNNAYGYRAMRFNTTGGYNTALGGDALYSNTTSNSNTAVGWASAFSNTTGASNTAVGETALYSNTTGATNVAVGREAMFNNTTAGNNTAVGYQAGYSNTVGRQNVAVGYLALRDGTHTVAGDYFNTAVGSQAMKANTTGQYNTGVGGLALYLNTTGSNNSSFGLSSMQANTTGASNTALGSQALQANTTASNNTAVGYQAGYSNTTGTQNVFLGTQAGSTNTTAVNNVAVGFKPFFGSAAVTGGSNAVVGNYALYVNTTGRDNTGIGQEIFQGNTTGNYNTAVGSNALYNNTTASNNTAVGYQAGYSKTTGDSITAVGRLALYSNTTGGSNEAFGLNALYSNTTGSNNVAMGTTALQANTTASNNTAVGYQALYASTGASNTSVGWKSGDANTSGYENVFLGTAAGTANTTGIRNLYVGNNAGELATTGSNNTFVGANGTAGSCGGAMTTGSKNTILGGYTGNQGGLDIRTSSNNIVLSDGDGNPRFRIDANGTATFDNAVSAQNNNVINVNSDYPSAGTTTMYMEADGDIATRSGSYGTISDQRLKQQITTANSQWDDVKAAVVKKYKFNADVDAFADDAPEQIGWIAQELEAAGLNGVVKDGQDGFKSVKTTVLMIKAFKALQEAMDRIETLEAKVTALENA